MRSARCSTRCARRVPLQSISFSAFLTFVLIAGVVLLGISTLMFRSIDRKNAPPKWPTLIDEEFSGADTDQRRDLIERLVLVPSVWSRETLSAALSEERDPELRSLIERSLSS